MTTNRADRLVLVAQAAVYRAIAGEEPDVVTPAALDEAILSADAAYVAQLEPITLDKLPGTDTRR